MEKSILRWSYWLGVISAVIAPPGVNRFLQVYRGKRDTVLIPFVTAESLGFERLRESIAVLIGCARAERSAEASGGAPYRTVRGGAGCLGGFEAPRCRRVGGAPAGRGIIS